MTQEKTKCSVRDGLFVEPCKTLADAVDNNMPGFSEAKGIFRQELTNRTTKAPSRVMFGIKSKAYPIGLLFNYCPWCGEKIDAPFNDQSE